MSRSRLLLRGFAPAGLGLVIAIAFIGHHSLLAKIVSVALSAFAFAEGVGLMLNFAGGVDVIGVKLSRDSTLKKLPLPMIRVVGFFIASWALAIGLSSVL